MPVMEAGKLKQLLSSASSAEPVHCAIGMAQTAKTAEILVSKSKAGMPLVGELKAAIEAGKQDKLATGATFGDAYPDDADPKLVVFKVNKAPAGGMAKRLRAALAGTGFKKVTLLDETGAVLESSREVDEAPGGGGAAVQPAGSMRAPEQAERVAPAVDAATTLKGRLTAAVQRIPQALTLDPSRKDNLLGLARQAQGQIGNEPARALGTIEQLEIAIDAPVIAKAPSGANPGAVNYAKSRLAWIAVRKQMERDLEKLRRQILEVYQGDDFVSALDASYTKRVAPVLTNLDESLADTLDDAMNASDPQRRAELVTQARAIIQRYQDFIRAESLFQELDNNPFVPLTISATITQTLHTLSAAVR